jgi:hypothetical protein
VLYNVNEFLIIQEKSSWMCEYMNQDFVLEWHVSHGKLDL